MYDTLTYYLIRFMQVTEPVTITPPTQDEFGLPKVAANDNTVEKLLPVVFGVIGAITVLIIVIAGLRMVLGGNDPEKIARAKRTLIFAFIGLAIALAAQAIVMFGLDRVF